jgi:TonB family protein
MKRILAPWAAIVVLVLLCAANGATETPDQIRHDVAPLLLHRTVYIRHSYSSTYLHFNEDGAILNGARMGYWSETGGVYPTRIEVWPSGLLHIEGERVAVAFNQRKERWDDVRRPHAAVVIEVQFAPGHLTVAQVQRTIGLIFATDVKELSSDLLPYWRPCVTGVLKADPHSKDRVYCFGKDVTPDMTTHAPVWTNAPRAGGDIQPARTLETHQPRFTDVARELMFNGSSILWLVVDEQGRPAEIYVASPAGYGLDDQAVNAISRWRFRPANENGRPVRVQMTVEISFKVPQARRSRPVFPRQ